MNFIKNIFDLLIDDKNVHVLNTAEWLYKIIILFSLILILCSRQVFLLNSWFICLNKFVPKYLFCTYTLPHLSSHWKSMYIAPLFKPLTRPQYVEVTDCINKQHTYRVKDWEILINGFWNPFVGLIFSSPSIYQDRNKSLNHVNWQIFANICIGIV